MPVGSVTENRIQRASVSGSITLGTDRRDGVTAQSTWQARLKQRVRRRQSLVCMQSGRSVHGGGTLEHNQVRRATLGRLCESRSSTKRRQNQKDRQAGK